MSAYLRKLLRAFLWIIAALFIFAILFVAVDWLQNSYHLNRVRGLHKEISVNTTLDDLFNKISGFDCLISAEIGGGNSQKISSFDELRSFMSNIGSKASVQIGAGPQNLLFPKSHYHFTIRLESPGKVIAIGEILRKHFDISNGPSHDVPVEP